MCSVLDQIHQNVRHARRVILGKINSVLPSQLIIPVDRTVLTVRMVNVRSVSMDIKIMKGIVCVISRTVSVV